MFLAGKLGKFNGLYSRYCLTTYCALQLTAEEFNQALALRSHWTYLSLTARTASFYRFAQLYWDGSTPSLGWLSTALATEQSIEEARTATGNAETGTGASSSSTPATASTGTMSADIKETLKALVKLLL